MTELLVETDLIAEYLTAPVGTVPALRDLLRSARCFSTFIQAAELFSLAKTEEEQRIVERGLYGLKIIGASSRYSRQIGALMQEQPGVNHRIAIVAAIALSANLTIITRTFFENYLTLGSIPALHTGKQLSLITPENLLQPLAVRGNGH